MNQTYEVERGIIKKTNLNQNTLAISSLEYFASFISVSTVMVYMIVFVHTRFLFQLFVK